MLCSTIIPSIGRASLSVAIDSVLDQKLGPGDLEIIVVNDSGEPLPKTAWQRLPNITIIQTNRRNRSVARNVGAAASRGKYLHFLDDDDWMLPGAYHSLLHVAETSKAAWIYGAFRLVDNSGSTVIEIHPDETGNCLLQMMAWEWLPLQASFIKSTAFFAVDGFASLPSLLGGFEDIHISRRIALRYEMARTENIVASIRIGDVGSTTNYVTMFDQNRQSREKVLEIHGAFRRMIESAKLNPSRPGYWYGKVIYFYLASLKWNLQKKRFFTAASRGAHMLAGFPLAGKHLFSVDFWRAVLRPHYNHMSSALQEAGAHYLYADTHRLIDQANRKPSR